MQSIDQQGATASEAQDVRPLVVDLDGTLVRTDLLVESVFVLLKLKPMFIFLLPLWLLKGKAHLKHQLASRVDIAAELLPYHEEFLGFLREEHSAGRRLVLATAANEKFAGAIAGRLGIFDEVLASSAVVNLSGPGKLEKLLERFGDGGFDYAGNSMADVPIFAHADSVLLVNPEMGVKSAMQQRSEISREFDDRSSVMFKGYLYALRPHQWLKNLLVFVPLVLAHKIGEPGLVVQALIAFLSFGLCASSVYLLNDLLDLQDDRRHPSKRYRAFASGRISPVNGALLIPVLLLAAFAIAATLPLNFLGILAIYFLINLAYSFRLKRVALLDVLILCGLYTLRIIAGTAAVSILPSYWLLVFSMFLFLSLALAKRVTELQMIEQQGRTDAPGRGYSTTDLGVLSQFGSASALMAVLVLALYINSDSVRLLYSYPQLIWLLCPLLLYMLTRIWLLTRRGELHEDPVVFVIQDRVSQGIAVVGAILLWLAA